MPRENEQVPRPEDWLRVQPHIRQLYVVDQRPLKDVSRILEEQHNFFATQRMYKSRIQAWKFDKKFKEDEWRQIIAMWKRRRDVEGKESIFKIRGRTINAAKIRKFLKRKKVDEGDFLSSTTESEPLSDIQCFTPTHSPQLNARRDSTDNASDLDQMPSPLTEQSRHDSFSWAANPDSDMRDAIMNDGTSSQGSHALFPSQRPSFSDIRHPHAASTSSNPVHAQIASISNRPASETMDLKRRLVYGIEGMAVRSLTPDSVVLEDSHDHILCNLIASGRQPLLAGDAADKDFLSQCQMRTPLNTVPAMISNDSVVICRSSLSPFSSFQELYSKQEDALPARWLSHLFQASIFHYQKRLDLAERNQNAAAEIFCTMIQSHNKYLLPGLAVLTGIMTSHHEYKLAASFLQQCCQIAQGCLGPEHPLTIAFQYMHCVCDEKTIEHIEADRLDRAIRHFELAWSADHPNTIMLKHLRAWELLRASADSRHPEKVIEAEKIIREQLPIAERVMGPNNYVTTWMLRSLSRACKEQKKLGDAINLMSLAIDRQMWTLGPYHPDRMEGKRRLGEMYQLSGNLEMAEQHFDEALWGQIKMLGVRHGLTMYTLEQLSDVMKKRGRMKEEAQLQELIDNLLEESQPESFTAPLQAY
ncbi:hypothetical protein UCRPC4_g05172 [Phaeomoniella chlamydospora]|uniref:Clr5 domain-containing protein n=1 Tax=Phaeomoniella chlamydospora TaxID=158046 RepID=A0A0G2GM85_PHACM|nr:hypothetical protein UCRPC4_g05172 [Phaeomoniella chlamydospora]